MGYLDNLIINTDNYKHCHYPLYPPGTEYVSSYIESRGGPGRSRCSSGCRPTCAST